MDKKLANNLIVGVFILVGFAGFLFVLFSISGGKGLFSQEYTLYGKWLNVKGLNFGSEVSLAGLRIGTVNKILISPEASTTKELTIEFTVSKDMFDKIREDSVAVIRTSGVLGDKYIEISIGDPSKPQIKPGSFIRCEEPADLFAKTGSVVENISSQFKSGSNFDQLIANLNRLSANLAGLTDEIRSKKGVDNFTRASEHLESIFRKVDKGEGTLGSLVNDPTVYEDLKAVMGGAKRSAVLNYFMRGFIQSGEEQQNQKKK